ncbi:MAG: hypothetical protein HZA20_05175 [Nitrospirae bacterium]|nr:hypothetical protein [Nitrospirota bacterium]
MQDMLSGYFMAYCEKFEGPKISYADIGKLMKASYDTGGAFCANTSYVLPTSDLMIIAIFHGKLFDWYIRQDFQALGDPWNGGRLRFFTQSMEQFPLPATTAAQKAPIIKLVETILANPDSPDVPSLEREIDRLVHELYGLTEEEIAVVEGKG